MKEGQVKFPGPLHRTASDSELLLRRLGAVGCATPLALAGVLSLAAVFAGLAPALALARVLALTSVLFFHLLVAFLILILVLCAERGFQRRKQGRSLNRRSGSGEQSRERRTCEHGL